MFEKESKSTFSLNLKAGSFENIAMHTDQKNFIVSGSDCIDP
jgi:hypothetical protein